MLGTNIGFTINTMVNLDHMSGINLPNDTTELSVIPENNAGNTPTHDLENPTESPLETTLSPVKTDTKTKEDVKQNLYAEEQGLSESEFVYHPVLGTNSSNYNKEQVPNSISKNDIPTNVNIVPPANTDVPSLDKNKDAPLSGTPPSNMDIPSLDKYKDASLSGTLERINLDTTEILTTLA